MSFAIHNYPQICQTQLSFLEYTACRISASDYRCSVIYAAHYEFLKLAPVTPSSILPIFISSHDFVGLLFSPSCYGSSNPESLIMTDATTRSPLSCFLVSTSGPLFKAATQSPFLVAAGDGTLSKQKLSEWLSQDRLYAQAYIGFIGSLFGHVKPPARHVPFSEHHKSIHWRIIHILRASQDNIFRELKFFEDTAAKYGLDLEAKSTTSPFGPMKATTDYIKLFRRFSCEIGYEELQGSDWVLLNGLVVLWATEKCYLEAWRFAKGQRDVTKAPAHVDADADGGALRDNFIPNWTSQKFADFVQQLEQLVDDLMEEANLWIIQDAQSECKVLWDEVLDIERRFWPEV